MQNGLVFHIQKYSLQDGPGIRTTVFLKGCPLNCAWCHNPEGISPGREVLVVENHCVGCGQCRLACPAGSTAPGQGPLPVRQQDCTLCGACAAACPTEARRIVGQEMSVAQLIQAVCQDCVFYEESAGGVTFSGGEPLLQFDFLRAALEACRARGLHTAIDTCGLAPLDHFLAVAPLTDLFLYDLKCADPVRHQHYTGVPNRPILENLQALGRVHGQIWVRVPIIPGINDDEAGLQATARFAAGIPGVRQANLLPFHRTGVPKFRRLGRRSPLDGLQPPSPEAMSKLLNIFRDAGLPAMVGG